MRPSALLLDEPTSALDAKRSAVLADLILEERDRGVGLAVVSHSLGFTKRASDRFMFLENGRLLPQGSWSELGSSEVPKIRENLALNSL